MPNPVPPENVQLVTHDGQSIPVELYYRGVDNDGIHQWVTILPARLDIRSIKKLTARMLPAKTAINIELR